MKHHSGFQSPINQVTGKCILSSKPVSINKFQKISFTTGELPVVTNSRKQKGEQNVESYILFMVYVFFVKENTVNLLKFDFCMTWYD